MRRLLLIGAALFVACSVQIPDYLGRACDATHDCVDGWFCVAGFCQPDAGPGLADGGGVWRQWVDGFISSTLTPAGCCTLDGGSSVDGNTVTVHVRDGTAQMNGAFEMAPEEGQLRGHIQVGGIPASGMVPLVVVQSQGGVFLTVSLTSAGALNVTSPAGAVQTDPTVDTVGSILSLSSHLIDVTWQAGAFRDIALDGTQVATHPLSGGFASATLDGISLGASIPDAGYDFSGSLTLWQLAQDPSATLTE